MLSIVEASEHTDFGEIIRRLRQDLGFSQAELARAAGVHLRQIRRYESGEQQPVLPVAVRLADALGVTVNQLAGQPSDRIQLDGTWWAAWQTFNEGREMIATQPVGLTQHGPAVQIEALERSSENERGGYLWRGELRLWDGQVLMGWYAAADGNVLSKGTMFFVLHAHGEYAEGRWVGLSYDGPIVTGFAALARTADNAQTVILRLIDSGRALP
jgi:transcriptional regulator with XRE-family HTH domain